MWGYSLGISDGPRYSKVRLIMGSGAAAISKNVYLVDTGSACGRFLSVQDRSLKGRCVIKYITHLQVVTAAHNIGYQMVALLIIDRQFAGVCQDCLHPAWALDRASCPKVAVCM